MSLDLDIVYCIRARVEKDDGHDWLNATFVSFSMTPVLNVAYDQVSCEEAGRAVLER